VELWERPLLTIGRNAAFSARRRRRLVEPLPDAEGDGELQANAPEPSLNGWDTMDIHAALSRLRLAHRDTLTLHFLEGFSIAEIGAITGTAEGTIKSRLYHAKRAMRALLEGDES
jgi:RNA polymerase sigma-70 factor (ECF subfamily)